MTALLLFYRSPGCAQVHLQGLSPTHADWFACNVCHPYLCYHWTRILLGSFTQDLLQC